MTDWMSRLDALVRERLRAPFAWGPNDCAAFGADAALALRGEDLLVELRGPRRNARQAARLVKAGGGIPAALARAGLQEVRPQFAQRGDLVWLEQDDWEVLAVCCGDLSAAPGPAGLSFAPTARATRAWRL